MKSITIVTTPNHDVTERESKGWRKIEEQLEHRHKELLGRIRSEITELMRNNISPETVYINHYTYFSLLNPYDHILDDSNKKMFGYPVVIDNKLRNNEYRIEHK
jgi:hypothetical protein